MNRREFCGAVAAFTAATMYGFQPEDAYALVASTDRERILRAAKQYVTRAPETITAVRAERSPGSPHDFYSESDYFWPDPKNPSGPYKERDGETNPSNFTEHRKRMVRLSIEMPALTAAWLLTKDSKYYRKVEAHLLAWFVHPETRMNPNLQYAQAVRQGVTGRSYGIIDTLHLVEVARAASFILPEMKEEERSAVKDWFRQYVAWLMTSEPGKKEGSATNNHAVAYALQVAEFARLYGDDARRETMRERYRNELLKQMATDGSFPRETARTKPYGYSIFNFDCMGALCWSLGKEADEKFALPDGRGMCLAAAWLFPYLEDKSKWPFRHDVQHWESWPVRSPGLLFTGLACEKKEYIALWKQLNPDPTDPEIIRNYPIRQPLLWVR